MSKPSEFAQELDSKMHIILDFKDPEQLSLFIEELILPFCSTPKTNFKTLNHLSIQAPGTGSAEGNEISELDYEPDLYEIDQESPFELLYEYHPKVKNVKS